MMMLMKMKKKKDDDYIPLEGDEYQKMDLD